MALRRSVLGASYDSDGHYRTGRIWGLWHVAPWVWPWVAPIPVLLLGVAFRLLWGATQWGPVAIVAMTGALTWVAWRAGRARSVLIRNGAAAAVALAGMWLLLVTIVGWHRPVAPDLALILGLGLPLTATIIRMQRGNGLDGESGRWAQFGEEVGLAKSRVRSTRVRGSAIDARIQVAPGQTQADVALAAPLIAAGVGAPSIGARVVPDPADASVATLTLVVDDLLGTPLDWRGLSAPGVSIAAAPIRAGLRESGHDLQLWLPADERGGRVAQHVLVVGMNGSGKSVFGRIFDAEVLSRPDAELWLIDQVKGRQYTRPFTGRAHRIATTDADATTLLAELPGLIAERADRLGELGLDNWQPGATWPDGRPMRYLVVHIEEADATVATSRPFTAAMKRARSTGLSFLVSMQRPTHEELKTIAREQFGTVIQFGCAKGGSKNSPLSSTTLAAGADPEAWKNDRPGMAYAETPGFDPTEWHAPARVELATADDIAAALTALGATPRPVQLQSEPEPPTAVAFRPEEARALLRSAIARLQHDGAEIIRPADLDDVRQTLNRSPAWMRLELKRLVDAGDLADAGHGRYRIVASFQTSGFSLTRARA